VTYRLIVTRAAKKGLASLHPEVQQRVSEHIAAILETPRMPQAAALAGSFAGLLKVRVGDYRIIYHVDDATQTIKVVRVGHRSNVYK
jgi:mRNA interferase RelE/StbE